jgi:hypothetical protein
VVSDLEKCVSCGLTPLVKNNFNQAAGWVFERRRQRFVYSVTVKVIKDDTIPSVLAVQRQVKRPIANTTVHGLGSGETPKPI